MLVAGVAFAVVCAAALVYRHYFGTTVSTSSSEWNNFGTFFGGLLGPILSMLAFFALVYTIFLQEQQLSLARSTLRAADADKEMTRKQLEAAVDTQRRTAEALALQNKLGSDQSTRAAFFEMVALHNQIVQDTETRLSDNVTLLPAKADCNANLFLGLGKSDVDISVISLFLPHVGAQLRITGLDAKEVAIR